MKGGLRRRHCPHPWVSQFHGGLVSVRLGFWFTSYPGLCTPLNSIPNPHPGNLGEQYFSSPLRSSSHSTEALSSLSFSLLLDFRGLVSQPWLPVCPWCCPCVLWVQDPTFSLFPLSSMPLPHHMLCQDPDSVCLRLCLGTCNVAIAVHLVLCSWVP